MNPAMKTLPIFSRAIRVTLPALAFSSFTMATEAARPVEVRCLSLASGYPETAVFAHENSGKTDACELQVKTFLNHKSETLQVEGGEVTFSGSAETPKEGPGAGALGKVSIPDGLQSCVFVFEAPSDGKPARVHVVDDAVARFPKGSLKVLNLTGAVLRLKLEGKVFDCPADKQTVIEDPPVGERNASAMQAFCKRNGQWIQVATSNWSHPGKKRVLQVATLDRSGRRVMMKGYRDISVR